MTPAIQMGSAPPDVSQATPHECPHFEGILEEGEVFIWQGRPKTGIVLSFNYVPFAIIGLLFAVFAALWMISTFQRGSPIWMFGIIHFIFGVLILVSPFVFAPRNRARTRYALTNQRALISSHSHMCQMRLRSFPITKDMPIELKKGKYPSVFFGPELFSDRSMRSLNGQASGTRKMGFELIDEAQEVYDTMCEIQDRLS
ncbi:hypothetical protein GCM10007939_21930 [Amylibacter marinus]|uniref:Uncharacterized protein n=1 Tax=Amylibacter marinus TaxID=1475483 RepID=A0ABQ5VXG9_9RHOB|nr:hypothetical protein [Amylibacter marinus]GLQ35909.1 hypothetical protein GCM10007939_21930 [Amylibacter marinus]